MTAAAIAIPAARGATCFYEVDPSLPLLRRGFVEGVGTLLLMFVVTAARMPLAGPAALVALIVAFQAVSGGHYNPLITLLQWLGRERTTRCTLTYVAAQAAGALLGAWLADAALGLERVAPVTPQIVTWSGAEFVATTGLMVVVFGCARSARADTGPFAVGAWVTAAAVTVPGAYMNPALSLGALLASGPVALNGAGLLTHLPAQGAGALLAFGIIRAAYYRNAPAANSSPATS